MEQALLQAERQAEQEQADAERELISQLQLKLSQLNKATQSEKDKVCTLSHNTLKLNKNHTTIKKKMDACDCLVLYALKTYSSTMVSNFIWD